MNSHDVGYQRGGAEKALGTIKARALVAGIDSDRYFPISGQQFIADHIGSQLVGGGLRTIESEFGHDGFLIEVDKVGPLLRELLEG